jgi:hypothetical protein
MKGLLRKPRYSKWSTGVLSLRTGVLVLTRVLVLNWSGVLVLSLGAGVLVLARVLVLWWYQEGVLVLQLVIMLGWGQQDRLS